MVIAEEGLTVARISRVYFRTPPLKPWNLLGTASKAPTSCWTRKWGAFVSSTIINRREYLWKKKKKFDAFGVASCRSPAVISSCFGFQKLGKITLSSRFRRTQSSQLRDYGWQHDSSLLNLANTINQEELLYDCISIFMGRYACVDVYGYKQ